MLRKPLAKSPQHATLQSERDRDFIAAFRLGRIDLAHKALDAGANPSYEIVHGEMLEADPALGKAAYRAMWELYFEMRGLLNDAHEITALSRALRNVAESHMAIARKAILAHIPKSLLPEVTGQLLADAVAAGDVSSVRLILVRGADLAYVDAQGTTILQHAAAAAHPEVFQLLIDAGLDLSHARLPDGRPLLMAVAATVTRSTHAGRPIADSGDFDAIQRFLARRKQDQHHAAETLQLLLALGLKPNQALRAPQDGSVLSRLQPATALQAAMRAHNPSAVEVLLNAGVAGVRTDDERHQAFVAAFCKHITDAFEDATVDALRIVGMVKQPRIRRGKSNASPVQSAIAALVAQRGIHDEALAAVPASRRAALMLRLNRALMLPDDVVAGADISAAFIDAVQARLPGVVSQLAAAGALPDTAALALPLQLLRSVRSIESTAITQLVALLDKRQSEAAPLAQGWNALIAEALIAAAGDGNGGSAADGTKAGKTLWSKAVVLRHAHQCEINGVERAAETAQRRQLLRDLRHVLGNLPWDGMWARGMALLAAPSVFDLLSHVAAAPASKKRA